MLILLRRIPGAGFFDVDGVADTSSELPHMLPSASVFAEACGALGIARQDTVLAPPVYSSGAAASRARLRAKNPA